MSPFPEYTNKGYIYTLTVMLIQVEGGKTKKRQIMSILLSRR